MNITKIAVVLVAAASAVGLTACGTTSTPSVSPNAGNQVSAAHNEADATFVKGMIPHHAQAVQMSELAPDGASSQQVKDLSMAISRAQGPEIEQMQGFLRAWGLPEQPTGSGMSGMEHSGMDQDGMSGMMSDQQMQSLRAAKGLAFDRMFLQMMTEHHTGAIQMAETELRDGQSVDAKSLAQKIIDAQRAEIDQMRELLKTV